MKFVVYRATQYNLPTININLVQNYSLILYKLSLGLLTACFIYSILRNKANFPTKFKSASSYSYTLYIIHFPILLFIFGIFQLKIENNAALMTTVYAISCAIIIYISKISARKVENMKLIK